MSEEDDGSGSADVVDFDALHAALGDLPPPPTSSSPTVGDSHGRSSATYSSARPRTIPPTRAPAEDPNAPAVIVQSEDTVPSGPPQKMTVPMGGGLYPPSSGPHPAAGGRPPSASHPGYATPQPFQPQGVPGSDNVQLTMQMPGRPRRPRTPTIVVRTRGPTKQQKLVVFMAMLLVFVGGGITFLILYKPPGISVDLRPGATTTAARTAATAPSNGTMTAAPTAPTTPTTPSATVSAAPLPTMTVSAPTSAAKKPLRRP